jgi:YVTN family beta-propeller protein
MAGRTLLAPIAAKVSDANGRGVPNIPVAFTVTAGEGSIEPATNRTNGAGIATVSWRVGTIVGRPQQVVATVLDTLTGALVDTAIFVATVAAGPPASIFSTAGNGVAIAAGQTTPVPLRAVVRDAHGNPVSGATVNWTVVAGQATLAAATSPTNSQGEAANTLTPGTSTGDIVVRASVAEVSSPASFFVQVRPPTVSPLSNSNIVIAVGQTTPLQLRVGVRDGLGEVLSGVTVNWTVVQGQATLAAPTSASNALGEATNTLTPGPSTGDIIVHASIAGASSPASFLIRPRQVSERAAFLRAGGFGIARTPAGELVVTLIHAGQVERASLTDPSRSAVTTVGGTPVVIAVDGAGQRAYAANMGGTGVLSVIDVPSMTKIADVDIPGEAHSLAMSPRGDRVYVTNTSNAVFAVDVGSRTIVSTTTTGAGPWGIVFWTTASDSLMYVTARDGGSITETDMRTGSVLRTISVTGRPHGIAIAPNGSTLYVADDTGEILFVDRASGVTTRRIAAAGAFGIAIALDGNTLYVTTNPGQILVVDVASATITKRTETEGQPRQILVLPDGNSALAANLGGWIDLVRR